jgi:hypothetical protein
MLDHTSIINQLKNITAFNGAVYRCPTIQHLSYLTNPASKPAAYVVQNGSKFGGDFEYRAGNTLRQVGTELFVVALWLDDTALPDEDSAFTVPALRSQIWSQILNFPQDDTHSTTNIYYLGDELMAYDNGRIFWLFHFGLDIQISSPDGYQPQSTSLTAVTVNSSIYNQYGSYYPGLTLAVTSSDFTGGISQ